VVFQSLEIRQSHHSRRGEWGAALRRQMCIAVLVLISGGVLSDAGEYGRPILIGALNASWGPTPQVVGLREGLMALGYRENEQFVIGVRFTQGDLTALPETAWKLVQDRVDIIFTDHDDAAKAAQQAATHIPIVFASVADPVGIGLIHSFARPGGNTTGVADLHLELGPKRLEIFRELIPGLQRVLFPYHATDAYAVSEARELRTAARRLGMVWVEQAVRTQEEAQATIAAVQPGEVDGILAPRCCALNIPGFVLEATTQRAIPTMFETAVFWVERGALASYGPDLYNSGRMAARLVDKIIKGANPAEIPVEVNSKLEFVINLKVAKALGLTLPPDVLYRADRLIR
jgi:putative tryptophan/tyrosine transport system substrate-binding protein